jgi:ribonuclease P protein component
VSGGNDRERFAILKNSAAFNAVFKQGKSFHTDAFVCFYLPCGDLAAAQRAQKGFVASKKVGGAAERNYAKRRMREIFRANEAKIPRGKYAMVAKKPILEANFAALLRDFSRAAHSFIKYSKGLDIA